MSLKRARSPSPTPKFTGQIYQSSEIEDRLSTFLAYYSPDIPVKLLAAHPNLKDSSHRITAYRTLSKQRAISPKAPLLYDTGCDDDGEKYAGKKLGKVLEEMNVEGAVVVARWYGGVLLGPVRFTHIENCAREAIRKCAVEAREEASKKRRLEADEEEKKRLGRELAERDSSIGVLRGLLAEKSDGKLEGSQKSTTDTTPGSPTKMIDYSKMPLEVLRRLDKARDATIAWLLGEIDKAEVEQKKTEGREAPASADVEEDGKPHGDRIL